MHVGYQCWDDEYKGIYLADSSSITPGTKRVRLPQSRWWANRVDVTMVESFIPLAGAYVHLRTGLASFTYIGRLPV